jgi:hypothetical protein
LISRPLEVPLLFVLYRTDCWPTVWLKCVLLTSLKGLEMDSGVLPRPGFHPHTSSPDGGFHTGWSFPSHDPAPLKMPSERLIRAVLSSMAGWLDSLAEIEHFAIPGNKSRVMQLRKDMTYSRISFMRLVNAPEAEIQAALKQANEDASWPRDDDK